MKPIKYTKIKDNLLDFDNMTLVNILSHEDKIIYFFIVEFIQKFRGKLSLEKELIEISEEEYLNIVSHSYKIL